MIEKIDITGSNYKVEDTFKKYATKRIGKLDKYLPRGAKKDIVVKIVVEAIERSHGEKFELSAAMEIPGGKVIAAKDECTNLYAGVDLVEAKLMGQIRRFKLESTPHLQKDKKAKKHSLKNLFIKRK